MDTEIESAVANINKKRNYTFNQVQYPDVNNYQKVLTATA